MFDPSNLVLFEGEPLAQATESAEPLLSSKDGPFILDIYVEDVGNLYLP